MTAIPPTTIGDGDSSNFPPTRTVLADDDTQSASKDFRRQFEDWQTATYELY